MITKFKILSSISFIALAIVLTFVGVWALTNLNFIVGGNITYTAPEPTIKLEWDEEGGFWYVTMGSTADVSEIKWRLVGLNGERYTSTIKPTSGKGTFILETNMNITYVFDERVTDYATSDIRAYLKGDYVTALNLANDATYKAIDTRSVSELYENMAWDTVKCKVENCTVPSSYDTTEDSLWLMSVAEIYTLIGGGIVGTDGIIPSSWDAEINNNLDWNSVGYWLRSPDPYNVDCVFYVCLNYGLDYDRVYYEECVRPAFNLNF